jgi:chromosome segregation ATPase
MTTVAEAQIDALQAEQKQTRRAELIAQLEKVRADIRTARARYAELVPVIKAERQARAEAQEKVSKAHAQLTDSFERCPRIAKFLPDDPEAVEWRTQHETLQRKYDKLIAERDALPDPERNVKEAGAFEGPFGIIGQLQFSEQNILRHLEPGPPSGGGVSGVM